MKVFLTFSSALFFSAMLACSQSQELNPRTDLARRFADANFVKAYYRSRVTGEFSYDVQSFLTEFDFMSARRCEGGCLELAAPFISELTNSKLVECSEGLQDMLLVVEDKKSSELIMFSLDFRQMKLRNQCYYVDAGFRENFESSFLARR